MPWISEQLGLMKTLIVFGSIMGISFAFFGYNHLIDLAILMYFIIGFAGAIWPLIISKAQSLTDINFQGRVQSTFNCLSGFLMLVFYFSVGFVSHYLNVSDLYWIEFFIMMSAIICLYYFKRSFD